MHRDPLQIRRFGSWACAALVWAIATHAQAEEPARSPGSAAVVPKAVLLTTANAQGGAGALDSVISAAVEELGAVKVVARPGLDLGAVQLVLDCVAETARCLKAVTEQHSAQVLIAPSLARTPGELVLSILRFDARDGQMERVLRRQQGQSLTSETLDAVPDMLRELFGLPVQAKKPPAGANTAPQSYEPLPEAPMEPPSRDSHVPVGPILLGSGAVLMLGTAIVLGATVQASQNEYDRITTKRTLDDSDVDDAIDIRNSAETRETLQYVFYGVGAATLVGAGIWLAVDLSNARKSEQVYSRFSPWLGPHQVGLVLTHRGAGL